MFGNKNAQKKVPLIKKDVACCQCHEKFANAYVKPEEEEGFREMFMMCPTCFSKLCDEINEKEKK